MPVSMPVLLAMVGFLFVLTVASRLILERRDGFCDPVPGRRNPTILGKKPDADNQNAGGRPNPIGRDVRNAKFPGNSPESRVQSRERRNSDRSWTHREMSTSV